ncbi:unnamed protein product [Miscanthus lutarioriparius]|uniref:Uncharacterized protein n=1 Tax=Miscanthus lutarioriparius TaxID=422564 RepID=A0A811SH50_9POAL|nr:unnamed protein product [Miscanthus lutarioriparius]
MASQTNETYRAGADITRGDAAACKKAAAELLAEIGLPKGLFPLEDMQEFGYNLQEDQADSVVRRRGDGVRGARQAEEDRGGEDQGARAVAQRRGSVRRRVRSRQGHLQGWHWAV